MKSRLLNPNRIDLCMSRHLAVPVDVAKSWDDLCIVVKG